MKRMFRYFNVAARKGGTLVELLLTAAITAAVTAAVIPGAVRLVKTMESQAGAALKTQPAVQASADDALFEALREIEGRNGRTYMAIICFDADGMPSGTYIRELKEIDAGR